MFEPNDTESDKDVRKYAIRIGIGSFVVGGLTFVITLLVHPLR
jgi:hypothetical protein